MTPQSHLWPSSCHCDPSWTPRHTKKRHTGYCCTEQKRGQGQAADNSKHLNIYLALECIFLKHKNQHSTAASTAEKGNTSVHIGKHSSSTAQRWGPCQSQDILWNSPLARPAPTPGPCWVFTSRRKGQKSHSQHKEFQSWNKWWESLGRDGELWVFPHRKLSPGVSGCRAELQVLPDHPILDLS